MNLNCQSGLTVRFRGVRGSLPSPERRMMRYGGNTSCVEIRSANQLLILDAGSGMRTLGEELGASGAPVNAALVLSHAHWDHIQGLPFFGPGYGPENRIQIFAAHTYQARLQQALLHQMTPVHFPVPFEAMRGLRRIEELSADVSRIGDVRIRTTELNHPGGCAGFRLEADGASLAYLPDHEPYSEAGGDDRAALVEFLRDVDLLILDTQYTETEYSRRIGWGHGYLPQSVMLALDARARRLAFFHHDPSHTDDHIDEMVNTAAPMIAGSSLIAEAAFESQVIHLPGTLGSLSSQPRLAQAVPNLISHLRHP